jgi:putative sterol carrier protein
MEQTMTIYTESFPIRFRPVARPEAIITGPGVRFTVLTSRLIRIEYSSTDTFEDRPSQAFWYREQPVPDYEVRREGGRIQIETQHLNLSCRPSDAGFRPDTLSVTLKEHDHIWHYGDANPDNLRGTARTLDQARGAVGLETGLVSRSGWAVVDDTDRLVFDDKGWLRHRNAVPGSQDLYFFGYGYDYTGCMQDYSRVAGQVPLLPRWVLGNWWSRYWAYSADELLGLMREFHENEVPLSVCIVDMDWHITDTGNRSSGWTGYTWNRELFPDPPAFIAALHELGLKTALNLHPALGVYPHEAQYEEMAERMGIDPATEEPVPFSIADPEFAQAYFEVLHHPYEAQGVDFWWIDWQQGTDSGVGGLDPLWWLNHLHFYDLGRDGKKRPFIFSRWGGLGNQRYPLGFSGDTVVSWESLAFQPYFTATAANVNYGWWSHDIGGHMGGVEDPELFARWVQYGVFSPIFRLHCTKNAYHERRPWGYDAETFRVTREAMQLRHALIPYLYSLSWRDHNDSVPPVRPMYYDWPMLEPAYHCPDQYTFGSELIAAPHITPADTETRMSRQVVWLPPGQWFGFFSGLSYKGDGWYAVYGGLDDIPVFAKAGAIVPLAPKVGWGGVDTPDALEIHLFPGADNRFELYEDDDKAAYSLTPFTQTWKPQRLRFEIGAAQGSIGHLPAQRAYTLLLRGIADAPVLVEKNGVAHDCTVDYDEDAAVLTVAAISLSPADTLTVTVTSAAESLIAARDHRMTSCLKLLRACRLDTNLKSLLDMRLADIVAHPSLLADFQLLLSESINRAFAEIITAAGAHRATDPADGGKRVILWNNAASPDVTFSFVGRPLVGWSAVRRAGPVPTFAVFKQSGKQLKVDLGTGAARAGDVTQWLDNLVAGFRPEKAGDLDVVVQFNFGAENGQQAYAHLSGGTLTVVSGVHDSPDVSIEADAGAWLALVYGEADPADLFLSGKLLVSGDMNLMMRLADLLVGGAEQMVFEFERWKLTINFLDLLTLELGQLG